jgi:Na+/pantothenate symporter
MHAASALVTAKYPINDPQSTPATIARAIFFSRSYASSESFIKNPESAYNIGSKFMVEVLLF